MEKLEAKLPRGGQRVVHGGYSFLTTGRLPEHRIVLIRYLTAVRSSLVADLAGSEDNLSAQQIILIDRCISLLGVIRCIEEHCKEKGVFKGDSLQPSLGKNYISFTNSLKQILQLLGLKRRTLDDIRSVQDVVREFDKKKSEEISPESEKKSGHGQTASSRGRNGEY